MDSEVLVQHGMSCIHIAFSNWHFKLAPQTQAVGQVVKVSKESAVSGFLCINRQLCCCLKDFENMKVAVNTTQRKVRGVACNRQKPGATSDKSRVETHL